MAGLDFPDGKQVGQALASRDLGCSVSNSSGTNFHGLRPAYSLFPNPSNANDASVTPAAKEHKRFAARTLPETAKPVHGTVALNPKPHAGSSRRTRKGLWREGETQGALEGDCGGSTTSARKHSNKHCGGACFESLGLHNKFSQSRECGQIAIAVEMSTASGA